MEMKGLKDNKQDEKGNLEHWKLTQNSPKLFQARSLHRNSPRRVYSSEVGLFSRQTNPSKY